MIKFNVLRFENGLPKDYMLGSSCDRTTAEQYAQKYNDDYPDAVRARREHSNSDTPDWRYIVVPVTFDHADWFPPELERMEA